MRSTRLFGTFSFLFLVVVAALSGLTLWNIDRSSFWDARVQLAQESYRAHLSLKSHVFQRLKQHGDALLIGDRDGGAGEAALREEIAGDIALIRDTIAREIKLVGEEEFEELALLAEMEREIDGIVRDLERFDASAEIDFPARQRILTDLLDRRVDRDFAQTIAAALEEEQEEVNETLAEAAAFRDTVRIALIALSAIACLLVAAFGLAYLRLIHRPLAQLRAILARFRRGEWSEPVRIDGGREFRDLGGVMSDMAAGLAARETSQRGEAERLEAMVEARTAEQKRLLVQIERTEARRRRLLADISHELRTPLTIIQGEADVTLRGGAQPAETYQDALARIRDSAKHTNRIVDDLLLISRQEAGELRLERRETELGSALQEAVDVFANDIEVVLPETPVRAHVDRLRLRQCLLAVFQNAKRHGGPNVRARIEVDGGKPRIVIEDDGPGLSDAEKDQAFDRFFRGSDASRGDAEGHGLGLPIVRSVIEAHGGTVALEDAEPSGLRVVITLPGRPRPALISQDGGLRAKPDEGANGTSG